MTLASKMPHSWKFVRSGGLDQVTLETADDLRCLGELDQKLWVVLSCPVKGLQVDERTLALIDTDGDGHVRPPEVIAAVSWAYAHLKDPASLLKGGDSLPLASISDGPEGTALADTARAILAKMGKKDAILAADAAETARSLAKGALKGDGILRPEAAADDATRDLIKDITTCFGTVTAETVESFFSDLESTRAWASKGQAVISDLGSAAAEAYAAVDSVRRKVDDYFARTKLASFDGAAVNGLNRTEVDFRAIGSGVLAPDSPELAAFPLARIEADKPLPLLEGVNPAWAAALARLQAEAVSPILGSGLTYLTADNWASLVARLKPYEAWIATKPSSKAAGLGLERVEAILSGNGKASLEALLAEDKLLAPRVAAATDVEKLALFYRDLGTILRNFVNLHDFYSNVRPAVFQAGTLYLDSRSCRLCILIDDFGAHAPFAAMSGVYVAYVECRRSGGLTLKVAAAFTQGDSDYLFVGRNGVFYDRSGRDWDATIVKVSEAPISIRQSFFSPYKKVSSFVSEQFAKFAASKEKAVESKLTDAVAAAPSQTAAPAPAFDIAKFAGIFAAIGLAIGTIGGALASVFSGLLHLPPICGPSL
jgi:hypothetical protein